MSLRRYGQDLVDTPDTQFQDLRGMRVYDQEDRLLGTIRAIMVDTTSKETVYAEVMSPSILGLGSRRQVVRRSRLHHNARGLRLARSPSQR